MCKVTVDINDKALQDDGEEIDLETFRADLHRMVEEVYA